MSRARRIDGNRAPQKRHRCGGSQTLVIAWVAGVCGGTKDLPSKAIDRAGAPQQVNNLVAPGRDWRTSPSVIEKSKRRRRHRRLAHADGYVGTRRHKISGAQAAIRDFTPIAMVAPPTSSSFPVRLPVKTLPEFIDYAKANKGKLSYGSWGPETLTHLAMEQLR